MTEALLQASIRGMVVVGLVWAVCRLVPALSPAARTWLWWTASASFLVAVLWTTPIAIEVLAPPPAASAADPAAEVPASSGVPPVVGLDEGDVLRPPVSSAPAIGGVRFAWRDGLVGIWLTGLFIAAAMALNRWRAVRRLVRTAGPASSSVAAMAGDLAAFPRYPACTSPWCPSGHRSTAEGTRTALESMSAGLPRVPYGLGRSFNITSRGTSDLVIVGREMVVTGTAGFRPIGEEHSFSFPGRTPADTGRLLVAAGDVLRTQLQ